MNKRRLLRNADVYTTIIIIINFAVGIIIGAGQHWNNLEVIVTNSIVITFFTLLVGVVGGLIGHKLRIPVGAMVGSMLAVGIYSSLGFDVFMPYQARIGAQILVGCILGLSLNRNTFIQLKSIIIPALVISISLLTGGLVTGFILFKFLELDIYTAFLGSSAGGMTELSLLALSIGGDGAKIAMLHLIRLLTVVFVMPAILHLFGKLFQKGNKKEPV